MTEKAKFAGVSDNSNLSSTSILICCPLHKKTCHQTIVYNSTKKTENNNIDIQSPRHGSSQIHKPTKVVLNF